VISRRFAPAFVVAATLVACTPPPAPAGERAPEAAGKAAVAKAPEPPRIDTEALQMAAHFERARALRDGVIAGEIEDLRAPATWLASQIDEATFPEPWRAHVRQIHASARAIVEAATIDAAAGEVATMARTCGACHRALAGGPTLTIPPPPEHVPGTNSHMMRHQWAAERMWEGLVVPSDEAWERGAAALAESPLASEALTENVELPEEALAMRERVHALGSRGKEVREPAERARIYGEFIAACATCHKGGC